MEREDEDVRSEQPQVPPYLLYPGAIGIGFLAAAFFGWMFDELNRWRDSVRKKR